MSGQPVSRGSLQTCMMSNLDRHLHSNLTRKVLIADVGNDFPLLPQQKKTQIRVPNFPEPRPATSSEARPPTQANQPARPSAATNFPALNNQAPTEAQQRQGDASVSSNGGISEALKQANKVCSHSAGCCEIGDSRRISSSG